MASATSERGPLRDPSLDTGYPGQQPGGYPGAPASPGAPGWRATPATPRPGSAYPGHQPGGYPGFQQAAPGGPPALPGADRSGGGKTGSGKTGGGKLKGKRGLLIGGAAVVAARQPSPGWIPARRPSRSARPTPAACKSNTGTALTAYNTTIDDLNAQASQAKLTTDMNTAIAELQTAAGQAQSASAKTALNGLLTELTAVRTDVQSGSVPSATVSQLNAAATKADNAC